MKALESPSGQGVPSRKRGTSEGFRVAQPASPGPASGPEHPAPEGDPEGLAAFCTSRVLISILCLLISILSPLPALAVEVEPLRVEQTISLHQPAQAQLTVSNPFGHSVGVQISAGPYRSFQPEPKIPSAESWLAFEPARFTLAPGASTTVQVRIEPPAAVSKDTAGEYLAAIVIDQLPAEETEDPRERRVEGPSRISIVPRLAIPVYLQIQGRQRAAVELAGISLQVVQRRASGKSPPQDFGGAPELLRIDTSLRNRGTVHARLTGTFALFREDGTMVRSGPLGKTAPILPSATLVLPTLFPLPPPGRCRLTLTLSGGPDHPILQREIPFEITGDGRVIQTSEGRK